MRARYMKRTTHSIADYSDYSEFYDRVYGSGAYWTDNSRQAHHAAGAGGGPNGYFEKWSHEMRVSTPQDYSSPKARWASSSSANCTTSSSST